jgi:hypothetical protein
VLIVPDQPNDRVNPEFLPSEHDDSDVGETSRRWPSRSSGDRILTNVSARTEPDLQMLDHLCWAFPTVADDEFSSDVLVLLQVAIAIF